MSRNEKAAPLSLSEDAAPETPITKSVPQSTANFDSLGRPLTDYTGPEFVAFSEGYASGWIAGVARGRQLADDEAAALWRNAARVVHEMANIAPRDEKADAERAERRADWWAERRGERRPA